MRVVSSNGVSLVSLYGKKNGAELLIAYSVVNTGYDRLGADDFNTIAKELGHAVNTVRTRESHL